MTFPHALAKENVNLKMNYYEYKNAKLLVARYAFDGTIALYMSEPNQAPEPITVNLSEWGFVAPANHVFVKNYSGLEGLAEGLEKAGLATKVKTVMFGFGSGYLMKLSFDAETLI